MTTSNINFFNSSNLAETSHLVAISHWGRGTLVLDFEAIKLSLALCLV